MKTNPLHRTAPRHRTRFPRPAQLPSHAARTVGETPGELIPLLRDRHTGFLDLCLYPGMTMTPLPQQYPTAV